MTLYLKFEVGILLHQIIETIDLRQGLRFDRSFADIEGDTIGDDTSRRCQTVVQRHCTLGDHHIGITAVFVATIELEENFLWRHHVRDLEDACAVDIELQRTFIEGDGAVVPRVFLEALEQQLALAATGTVFVIRLADVLIHHIRISIIRTPRESNIAHDVIPITLTGHERDEPIGIIQTLIIAEIHIPLGGKLIRQPCFGFLHQRHYFTRILGEKDIFLSVERSYFCSTAVNVPFRGKLT